ncbi:hypothetical protein C4571_01850 [Candidatus Parcubacteria bacterium]|nr:MAG: hypothetical protein C4571_01850 [Candidatus Parcubacteria bacterium]
MAEEQIINFEKVLESDMQRLAEEVQRHRERPESRSAGDLEILKRSIQSVTQISPASPSQPVSDSKSPLPSYAENASSETKLEIEYLLDLAFREGILKATNEARKSNPFVLDTFHDALAGKLYPEFQKRGILK